MLTTAAQFTSWPLATVSDWVQHHQPSIVLKPSGWPKTTWTHDHVCGPWSILCHFQPPYFLVASQKSAAVHGTSWTGNPNDQPSRHSTSASMGSDYKSWAQTGAQAGLLELQRAHFQANLPNPPGSGTFVQLGIEIWSSIQGSIY